MLAKPGLVLHVVTYHVVVQTGISYMVTEAAQEGEGGSYRTSQGQTFGIITSFLPHSEVKVSYEASPDFRDGII